MSRPFGRLFFLEKIMVEFLLQNEIFVFGSNTEGRHGAGAAKAAMVWGAEYGKNSGRQGQTYAIITKDLRTGFIGWDFIRIQLEVLMKYAQRNDDLIFLLTPLATGLAGQTIEDLNNAIKDLYFPDNIIKLWET
jgi:hypothetical protein